MDQCCSHHNDLSPRKELKIAIKTNLKDTVRLGCGSIKKHSDMLLCSDTSAVWTLVPAVGAVRNPIAQFSHMNAEISSSTLVLVGRAPRYSAVWACKTWRTQSSVQKLKFIQSNWSKLCSLTKKKLKPFHVIILLVNSFPPLYPVKSSYCPVHEVSVKYSNGHFYKNLSQYLASVWTPHIVYYILETTVWRNWFHSKHYFSPIIVHLAALLIVNWCILDVIQIKFGCQLKEVALGRL